MCADIVTTRDRLRQKTKDFYKAERWTALTREVLRQLNGAAEAGRIQHTVNIQHMLQTLNETSITPKDARDYLKGVLTGEPHNLKIGNDTPSAMEVSWAESFKEVT